MDLSRIDPLDPPRVRCRECGERLVTVNVAHLPYAGLRRWTPERILAELRGRARRGRPVSAAALARSCGGLLAAARRRFGSWEGTLKAAGLSSVPHRRRWTRERVMEELRALTRREGSFGPCAAIRADAGLYQAAVVRFGSWRAAVKAALWR